MGPTKSFTFSPGDLRVAIHGSVNLPNVFQGQPILVLFPGCFEKKDLNNDINPLKLPFSVLKNCGFQQETIGFL